MKECTRTEGNKKKNQRQLAFEVQRKNSKRAENTFAQTMGLERVRKDSDKPDVVWNSIVSMKRREEKQVGDIMKSKYFPIVFSFALCKL